MKYILILLCLIAACKKEGLIPSPSKESHIESDDNNDNDNDDKDSDD